MSELISLRIKEAATRLQLANLEDNLTTLCERADSGQLGYLEFLDFVLEEETGVRDGRRFRNALKLSGLAPQDDRRVRLRLSARSRQAEGPRPGELGLRGD